VSFINIFRSFYVSESFKCDKNKRIIFVIKWDDGWSLLFLFPCVTYFIFFIYYAVSFGLGWSYYDPEGSLNTQSCKHHFNVFSHHQFCYQIHFQINFNIMFRKWVISKLKFIKINCRSFSKFSIDLQLKQINISTILDIWKTFMIFTSNLTLYLFLIKWWLILSNLYF